MLTAEVVLSRAMETLAANGYTTRREVSPFAGALAAAIAEDPLGVVAIAVYDTFETLTLAWHDAQDQVLDLLRSRLSPADPKNKEAYLVLFCMTPSYDYERVREIREDTLGARKFVNLGQHLDNLSEVDNALLPLLPLESDLRLSEQQDALAALPSILERRKIPTGVAEKVVRSFVRGEPLMDALEPDHAT